MPKNVFGKYFIYAFGEVGLVVTGILVALWINNWNEEQKLKSIEIELLEGIKSDLYQDTLDLNYNMESYEISIETGQEVLNHLINKQPYSPEFVDDLLSISSGNVVINFRKAHFDEAKTRGLAIISNKVLRASISKLYEFDYTLLTQAENMLEPYDSYKLLHTAATAYIGQNASGPNISKKNYQRLLQDDLLHFQIAFSINMNEQLAHILYKSTKEKLLDLVAAIETELETLQ